MTPTAPGVGIVGLPMMQISVALGPPVELQTAEGSTRRCIPIVGGDVTGGYHGIVLGGGADWQTVRPDGSIEIDANYILQIGSGRVEVSSLGLRCGPPAVLERLKRGEPVAPSEYYFRTAIRFRTADRALWHLNNLLAISHGERRAGKVLLEVFEVA